MTTDEKQGVTALVLYLITLVLLLSYDERLGFAWLAWRLAHNLTTPSTQQHSQPKQ